VPRTHRPRLAVRLAGYTMGIIPLPKRLRFTTLTLMLLVAAFALGLVTWQRWEARWRQWNRFLGHAERARRASSDLERAARQGVIEVGIHQDAADCARVADYYERLGRAYERAAWHLWEPMPAMEPMPRTPSEELLGKVKGHRPTQQEIERLRQLLSPTHGGSCGRGQVSGTSPGSVGRSGDLGVDEDRPLFRAEGVATHNTSAMSSGHVPR
jgi:hypothetical protein